MRILRMTAVLCLLAGLAFAQQDLKRLVAYTSVSHLGFVLVGIFSGSELALQGTVMQMIAHGISTGALFVIVGALQERVQTRDLARLGGLWGDFPKMGALAMVFAMASLGLPGMGNFIAEILILMGSFRTSPAIATIAASGFVLATLYSLRFVQAVFFGPVRTRFPGVRDLSVRDLATLGALMVAIVFLGFFPEPVFRVAAPFIAGVHHVSR